MSDDTSSSSTLISLPIVETSVPKTILGTPVKLNGSNYLLWAQVFRIFISAKNKLAYLLQSPPAATDLTYATWLSGDYCVMTWLLNNLEVKISGSVMFLTTAKKMWNTLKVMYKNEKNSSSVVKFYECLFELQQGDKSVLEFNGELKGPIDELEMHQPAITDVATLRGCRPDLAVSKFLFSLSSPLRSQVRCQILGGDNIPTLTVTSP